MTASTIVPPAPVEEETATGTANSVAERTQRTTGSFATRLLQKALDDRKKTEPNLKVPDLAAAATIKTDV